MNLMRCLKLIVAIAPFVLLSLLISRANLSKANRSRQVAMPLIALAYCIVALLYLDPLWEAIRRGLTFVGRYLPIVYRFNWSYWMMFLANIALMAGFALLKTICLPLMSALGSRFKPMMEAAGMFYEYEETLDKWVLKKKWGQIKTYYTGIYAAALTVSSLVMIFARVMPAKPYLQAPYYPAFCILILGEVVFFLSGLTRTEFIEDILGEDEESYTVANYGILRSILHDLFPDRILHEQTGDNTDGIASSYETLEQMLASDSQSIQAIGRYFTDLKQKGEPVDVNYVKSCLGLIGGKSTLFCNPFYRDLTMYLMLPMIRHLMRYQKCLIVVGRDSAAEDVKQWMDDGVFETINTSSLWKTEILRADTVECDIGIVRFSDLYDLELQKNNEEFLSQVGFVLIVEPSRILATGQVGLNLLAGCCGNGREDVVYCACDRNCDGLVDALSHTLRTSITEVSATLPATGTCSQMFWDADGKYIHHRIFPNVSRYLGIGTELGAVALKYQVSNVTWLSSERFPVLDMKWIAGQYYQKICSYCNLPPSQSALAEAFGVEANLWNFEARENAYLVVEDEFQNLFELTRLFASRAKNQGFLNVISGNYLLRDYMLDNARTFQTDPKAIPTIVPDFARTERNTVLKLIMQMRVSQVSEQTVAKEFMLGGIQFTDVFAALKALILKHCCIDDVSIRVSFRETWGDDGLQSTTEKYFNIEDDTQIARYARILQNACYINEDEEGSGHLIGAKLFGHVFQAMLPGQFVTFAGKYYQIQTITPENGVVVRRAADHINDRRYYRQLRRVALTNWQDDQTMGGCRTVSDMEVARGFVDLHVATDGYLEMSSCDDLRGARKVLLSSIPERSYRNKLALRVRLPGSSDKVRYTICLLLNEIFRTTYPDSWPYISALMPGGSALSEGLQHAMYGFETDGDQDCIYIIEDSEIDLGLVVSVDRNLHRYLELITEILNWHMTKMLEEPAAETEEPEYTPTFPPKEKKECWLKRLWKKLFGKKKPKQTEEETEVPTQTDPPAETPAEAEGTPEAEAEATEAPKEKKERWFKRLWKKLFGRKKSAQTPAEEEPEEPAAEEPSEEAPSEAPAETAAEEASAEETAEEDNPGEETAAEEEAEPAAEPEQPEETDPADEQETIRGSRTGEILREVTEDGLDIEGEDEVVVSSGEKRKTAYQKNCFLNFGYEQPDPAIDAAATVEYLSRYGCGDNPLQQARDGAAEAAEYEKTYDPKKYGVHLCDFCAVELAGGEYDVLGDGRERCSHCSATALRTGEEFKEVFRNVLRNMETFYGIKLNVAIKVRMTDAKKIARHCGEKFVPTPGFDGRVLGFAKRDRTGYSIYVENGSPRLAAIATIAHELTHIWQYLNWNDKELDRLYGRHNRLEIYEGMAKWAEIQYLLYLGEIHYAKRQEINTRLRDDPYGRGFIQYAEKYPLSYGPAKKRTPFGENPPL